MAAWLLWETSVPSDLSIPDLSEDAFFTQSELDKADDYELFHRVNWLLSTVVLFVVLGIYAVKGVRFMRESAAGRIGTGMLLAMLGFGLVWLVSVPFAVAGNWWDRRHGVSKVDYWELLFDGWLGLGAQFLFLSLSVLIVMGLAGLVGDWWWIPGSLAFVGLATLFVFISPYLTTDTHGIEDSKLAADVRRLAQIQGVEDVEVRVEDVDRYTSAANAYATGLGPSRKVFLWNTLLDGRFRDDEVRAVTAHEFGHQSQNHLLEGDCLVRAVRCARCVGDRPHHPPPRGDATPRGRSPLAARAGRAVVRRPAAPERHLSAHGARGGLAGAGDDARSRRSDRAVPDIRRDQPRRSDAARVGVRPARHASAAARPHRDGPGVEGPQPRRHATVLIGNDRA